MASRITPNYFISNSKSEFYLDINEYLTQCDSKDVISFESKKWISVSKLKDIIYQSFYSAGIESVVTHIAQNSDLNDISKMYSWFFQGEECEILKAGSKGWQKGKIKINVTLEFIPDESESVESPLDDVRQEFNQSNS